MDKWITDGNRIRLEITKRMLEDSEAALDNQAAAFFEFSPDDGDRRITMYYEGREFPGYVEPNSDKGAVSWSKALGSRIVGEFPEYETYLQSPDQGIPALVFEPDDEGAYVLKLDLPWENGLSRKQQLFDYFGTGAGTDNFADAYEIEFMKEFFEELSNRGQSDVFMVSGKLKKFFTEREKQTGEQDRSARKQIASVADAGLDDILSFLMDGPYQKASEMGIMSLQQNDDHFVFQLDHELLDELSTDDRNFIKDSLGEKLTAYFDRQDAPSLSDSLNAFITDYTSFYGKDFRYSFKDVILQAIPAGIANTGIYPPGEFKITGFAGTDSWTEVPYIRISEKNQQAGGVNVSYILDKETGKLYLSLVLESTDIERELRKAGRADAEALTAAALLQTAQLIRRNLEPGSFSGDVEEAVFNDQKLKNGMIFYKVYENGAPQEDTIEEDLKEARILLDELAQLDFERLGEEPEEPEKSAEVQAQPAEDQIVRTGSDAAEEIAEAEIVTETESSTAEVEPAPDEEVSAQGSTEDSDGSAGEQTGAVSDDTDAADSGETVQAQTADGGLTAETEAEPETEAGTKGPARPESQSLFADKVDNVLTEISSEAPAAPVQRHSGISREAILNAQEVLKESRQRRGTTEKAAVRPEKIYKNPKKAGEALESITGYMRSRGFPVPEEAVQNLYLSLKAVPLAGVAGKPVSDRDEFVRLFAEASGADAVNGRFLQIRLKNTDNPLAVLFGSYDPHSGRTIPGVLTSFAGQAEAEPDAPFFLYLKDLPLSADQDIVGELLALADSRHRSGRRIVTDPLFAPGTIGPDGADRRCVLPGNLFVIVSPEAGRADAEDLKTIDHLNLIQTPVLPLLCPNEEKRPAGEYASEFFSGPYLSLSDAEGDISSLNDVIVLLEAMNGVLAKADARIGRKVMDEICLYLLYNGRENLMSQEKALDYVILQKILPKITGSGEQVETALTDLFKICAGTKSDTAVRNYAGQGGLFPNSAAQLSNMVRALDRKGVTSVLD